MLGILEIEIKAARRKITSGEEEKARGKENGLLSSPSQNPQTNKQNLTEEGHVPTEAHKFIIWLKDNSLIFMISSLL